MPCKVLVRMKQFGRGWTYTFHSTHESAKSAVQDFAAIKSQLIKVHDRGTFIKWISASKIGTRQRWREDINLNPVKAGSNFEADADEVSTAARIRIFADNGASRFLWLRGLADTAVKKTASGDDAPDGAWESRLQNFLGVIGAQGANVAVRSLKEATGNYRYIDVLNLVATPASNSKNTTITLREAPPFTAGQRVIFTPPGLDPLLLPYRNSHVVKSVSGEADTFIINASYIGPVAGHQPTGMRVRWEDYDFEPATGANFVAFGKKDTGPDDSPRGREPGVSYRHA